MTEKLDQREIVERFQAMCNQQTQLSSKLAELEAERAEHELVLETLEKTPDSRKCFRLIGGVLIERTVKEVFPAVKQNESNLCKIIGELQEELNKIIIDISEYKQKYNIMTQEEYLARPRQVV
ncbi:hypothetical protein Zmor_004119 [Zophobas morio]|uniref:Prefoldin subunit 2 n=1 Tax=Zophobas morio TaxID=2755281 RepID=A0AA38HN34_9CUCU|nr:hypothetical protein Zmor_004119 [Zophobas morio]